VSEPATGLLRELERELLMASDGGETRLFEELRESLNVEAEELAAALDILRTHGKAAEITPNEWGVQDSTAVAVAPGGGRVEVPSTVTEASEEPDAAAAALRRLDGDRPVAVDDPRHPLYASELRQLGQVGQANVRLTRGVAGALSPESLGALVKAGIDESTGTFTLEVTP
jgi:hypothetical protein